MLQKEKKKNQITAYHTTFLFSACGSLKPEFSSFSILTPFLSALFGFSASALPQSTLTGFFASD